MRETILKKSKEIGIDIIGFTDNNTFDDTRNIIQSRIEKGYLSPFFKSNIEQSTDPLKVWKDTKSIICIGVSYNTKITSKSEVNRGKISKVAWGKDYHIVLMDKIRILMGQIQSIYPDVMYRAFVDDAPMLDRAIAERCGIGFYGKNGFVINPEYGSYIFLGHILINVDLGNSESVDSLCGTCGKCIKACPTQALEGELRLNPNKCISYLTQKKGLLRRSERIAIGRNLYGCDICQEVCPINKQAKTVTNNEFYAKESIIMPRLDNIINIDNKTFKNLYGSTSAGWRGKKNLQRNAIIVAGNINSDENFGLLDKCLNDDRWDIRIYAMFSLLEYGKKGLEIVNEKLIAENEAFIDKFHLYK